MVNGDDYKNGFGKPHGAAISGVIAQSENGLKYIWDALSLAVRLFTTIAIDGTVLLSTIAGCIELASLIVFVGFGCISFDIICLFRVIIVVCAGSCTLLLKDIIAGCIASAVILVGCMPSPDIIGCQ